MKKNNKKGFTLAELLIVVAIIAVLVAVAIPIFNGQLEKAREATYAANLRAAYAEAAVDVLEDDTLNTTKYTFSGKDYNVTKADTGVITVTLTVDSKSYTYDGSTFGGFSSITPGT